MCTCYPVTRVGGEPLVVVRTSKRVRERVYRIVNCEICFKSPETAKFEIKSDNNGLGFGRVHYHRHHHYNYFFKIINLFFFQ